MHQSRTLCVGLDVPTDSLAVAYVAKDHDAAVIALGTCGTRQGDIAPLVRQRQSKATQRVFVDAAGPWGAWRARSLTTKADGGGVVAPSLMPTKAGDRVTTDRRDARQLARLRRSGDLPPVYGPAVDEAAMRALRRARAETLRDLQAATGRLKAVVLRHAIRSPGCAPWPPAPLRWRSEGRCPTPAQPLVLQADVQTVPAPTARVGRLARARHEQGPTGRFQPVVEALQALRGVPCPGAVPTGAAVGDLTRVAPPRQRRHSRGRTPSA